MFLIVFLNIQTVCRIALSIFIACQKLRLLDVGNLGPERPVPDVCRILRSYVQSDLSGSLLETS